MLPPITASISPTTTYAIAIRQLNILARRSTDAKSTNGDEIRNENVTPIGNPALVNPMNKGIDEQEQKGVTVPKRAANILATIPSLSPSILLVLSGGKKLCIYEIAKISTESSINILTTSYIKKCMLPPSLLAISSPNTFSNNPLTSS